MKRILINSSYGDELRVALVDGAKLYDLDTEAVEKAEELNMKMERVPTVGVSKPFVEMIIDLIKERMTENPERKTLGKRGPNHDICPIDCCKVVTGVWNSVNNINRFKS